MRSDILNDPASNDFEDLLVILSEVFAVSLSEKSAHGLLDVGLVESISISNVEVDFRDDRICVPVVVSRDNVPDITSQRGRLDVVLGSSDNLELLGLSSSLLSEGFSFSLSFLSASFSLSCSSLSSRSFLT